MLKDKPKIGGAIRSRQRFAGLPQALLITRQHRYFFLHIMPVTKSRTTNQHACRKHPLRLWSRCYSWLRGCQKGKSSAPPQVLNHAQSSRLFLSFCKSSNLLKCQSTALLLVLGQVPTSVRLSRRLLYNNPNCKHHASCAGKATSVVRC